MDLNVKLYAGLEAYLPADAVDNSIQLTIEKSTTVYDILDRCQIPRSEAHLILLNGIFVVPGDRDKAGILRDEDTLALWPKVAGG